jgi:hypothetical protein
MVVKHSDLSAEQLGCLAALGRSGQAVPPDGMLDRFVRLGLADRTDFGAKITSKGVLILGEARRNQRLPEVE